MLGSTDEVGSWNVNKALEMTLKDDSVWTTVLDVPDAQEMHYKYVVLTQPEYEPNIDENRQISISPSSPGDLTIVEFLGNGARSLQVGGIATGGQESMTECRFELVVDDEEADQISLIGDHPSLGDWCEDDGISLERQGKSNLWAATVALPSGSTISYKYLVWRAPVTDVCGLENRHLHVAADGAKTHVKDNIYHISPPLSHASKPQGSRKPGSKAASSLCQFDVVVPGAAEGTRVFVLGSHDFLGDWQVCTYVWL